MPELENEREDGHSEARIELAPELPPIDQGDSYLGGFGIGLALGWLALVALLVRWVRGA